MRALPRGFAAGCGRLGEVPVKGNLPAPPWFNLAWWVFRTFITFEAGGGAPTSADNPPAQGLMPSRGP
jgi:hypothetical protein